MKKLIVALLSLVMVLGLTACNGSNGGSAEKEEGGSEGGKVYKVAYLINGNLGDKSFFDSAQSGLDELKAAGRIDVKTIEMGASDADQPKWQQTMDEVCESEEYDVVIVGTWQMADVVKGAVESYPNQKIIAFDTNDYAGQPGFENVAWITYKQNDLGYLVGTLVGGMTTKTDVKGINPEKVVGFVGGTDTPVINDFLYGYLLGAQSVEPDIKVDTRYIGNYTDSAQGKEYGASMIKDSKADLIWGVAGNAGNGANEAILEAGEGWFVGVDSDQELTFNADQAAITLTSGLKNVGNSLVWFFDELDAGKAHWGESVSLGIAEGGVGVVTDKNYEKNVPQDVKDLVAAAEKDILDGKVTVPSAFDEGGNEAAIALRDSVKP